jgi:hypothetical protein
MVLIGGTFVLGGGSGEIDGDASALGKAESIIVLRVGIAFVRAPTKQGSTNHPSDDFLNDSLIGVSGRRSKSDRGIWHLVRYS